MGEASCKTGGGSGGSQEEQGLRLPALFFRRQYRQRQWLREGSCGLRVRLAVQPDCCAHSRQIPRQAPLGLYMERVWKVPTLKHGGLFSGFFFFSFLSICCVYVL